MRAAGFPQPDKVSEPWQQDELIGRPARGGLSFARRLCPVTCMCKPSALSRGGEGSTGARVIRARCDSRADVARFAKLVQIDLFARRGQPFSDFFSIFFWTRNGSLRNMMNALRIRPTHSARTTRPALIVVLPQRNAFDSISHRGQAIRRTTHHRTMVQCRVALSALRHTEAAALRP